MENKKYYTQQEASEILNVKVATLNSWRCSGKHSIPTVKLGRVILYPVVAFHEWLESNSVNFNGGVCND